MPLKTHKTILYLGEFTKPVKVTVYYAYREGSPELPDQPGEPEGAEIQSIYAYIDQRHIDISQVLTDDYIARIEQEISI